MVSKTDPDYSHVVDVLDARADFDARIDCLCKTGRVGDDGDQESDGSAPVEAVPVAVAATTLTIMSFSRSQTGCTHSVQRGDVDALVLDDPVVACRDGGYWCEKDGKARHEVEQALRRVNNLPRYPSEGQRRI